LQRAEIVTQWQPDGAFTGFYTELAGLLIQPIKADARRRFLRQATGGQMLHKIRPNLQSAASTTEWCRTVVIAAQPHNREMLTTIPRKPTVALVIGGPGFTG